MVRQANESAYFHELSGKTEVKQFAWTSVFNWNLTLFALDKNKKDPFPYIKQTECDMDSKIKFKVFKEMVIEFRTRI